MQGGGGGLRIIEFKTAGKAFVKKGGNMPQKTAKQARALFMILLGLSLLPFSARADRLEDTRLYQMAQQENFSDFLRAR